MVVAGGWVVGGFVVVVANAAKVVAVTVDVSAGVAPVMVVFKLAFPWNNARIFFAVALSKSGRITDISSMTVPVPGMV